MRIIVSLHPRPSVRGEEPPPTRGGRYIEHSRSKGVNLKKTIPNNPTVCVLCLRDEWQCVSLSLMAPSGILGDLPVVFSLIKYGGSAWWISIIPLLSWEGSTMVTLTDINK
jgi:hypothetical protein